MPTLGAKNAPKMGHPLPWNVHTNSTFDTLALPPYLKNHRLWGKRLHDGGTEFGFE